MAVLTQPKTVLVPAVKVRKCVLFSTPVTERTSLAMKRQAQ